MDLGSNENSRQLTLMVAALVTAITSSTDNLLYLEVLGYLLETIGAGVLAIVAQRAGVAAIIEANQIQQDLASLTERVRELEGQLIR
ncbi:MAG: hypothetical protein ACM3NT_02475 [Methylocystaceae bacterium]